MSTFRTQDASGNLADRIGATALTTSHRPSRTTVAGWSRKRLTARDLGSALRKSVLVNLIVFPLVMLLTYGAPSCGGATGQVIAGAGSDWVACAKADSGGVIGQAVADLEGLATLNAATLEADALALIGTLGFDAVDCAVKVIEELIATATHPAAGSGSAVAPAGGAETLKLRAMAPGVSRLRAVIERERPKHAAAK